MLIRKPATNKGICEQWGWTVHFQRFIANHLQLSAGQLRIKIFLNFKLTTLIRHLWVGGHSNKYPTVGKCLHVGRNFSEMLQKQTRILLIVLLLIVGLKSAYSQKNSKRLLFDKLSNYITRLPKKSYFKADKGYVLITPTDSIFFSEDSKSAFVDKPTLKCLIIQKEGYNNYIVFNHSILSSDATYISSSLKLISSTNKTITLVSYSWDKGQTVDTIKVKASGEIAINTQRLK